VTEPNPFQVIADDLGCTVDNVLNMTRGELEAALANVVRRHDQVNADLAWIEAAQQVTTEGETPVTDAATKPNLTFTIGRRPDDAACPECGACEECVPLTFGLARRDGPRLCVDCANKAMPGYGHLAEALEQLDSVVYCEFDEGRRTAAVLQAVIALHDLAREYATEDADPLAAAVADLPCPLDPPTAL